MGSNLSKPRVIIAKREKYSGRNSVRVEKNLKKVLHSVEELSLPTKQIRDVQKIRQWDERYENSSTLPFTNAGIRYFIRKAEIERNFSTAVELSKIVGDWKNVQRLVSKIENAFLSAQENYGVLKIRDKLRASDVRIGVKSLQKLEKMHLDFPNVKGARVYEFAGNVKEASRIIRIFEHQKKFPAAGEISAIIGDKNMARRFALLVEKDGDPLNAAKILLMADEKKLALEIASRMEKRIALDLKKIGSTTIERKSKFFREEKYRAKRLQFRATIIRAFAGDEKKVLRTIEQYKKEKRFIFSSVLYALIGRESQGLRLAIDKKKVDYIPHFDSLRRMMIYAHFVKNPKKRISLCFDMLESAGVFRENDERVRVG